MTNCKALILVKLITCYNSKLYICQLVKFPIVGGKPQVRVSAINSLGYWVWPARSLRKGHPLFATLATEKAFFHLGSYLSHLSRVLRGFSFFKIAHANFISSYFFARPLAATLYRRKITFHYLHWMGQRSFKPPVVLCAHEHMGVFFIQNTCPIFEHTHNIHLDVGTAGALGRLFKITW